MGEIPGTLNHPSRTGRARLPDIHDAGTARAAYVVEDFILTDTLFADLGLADPLLRALADRGHA
ncbi:MAG: hypothetical protein AAFN17_05690, partial [Pseudomonadota bacterium]